MKNMTLFDLMDRLELTWIGVSIKESLWLFPAIESVHLLGLALLGGTILVVDLRLLGWSVTSKSPGQIVRELNVWFLAALFLMFATGIPLFLSEAIKCYNNDSFWIKIIALILALIYTFAIHNPIVTKHQQLNHWALRAMAIVSIMLWTTVAAAGRWIGFS
jgi:hypothetical protein